MITRRFILLFLLALCPLVTAAEKPNVLMICIDDLNDWVGCMKTHPQAKTPNIDALAQRGMLFTNAHCQAPICGPSRASLLSGTYPHSNGVYNQPTALQTDTRLFKGHLLPEHLAQNGYVTMGCGKTTHGYPNDEAFQHYGPKGSSGPKPPNGHRFNYHLPDVPWTGTQTDWGAYPDRDDKMPDYQVASWAVEQLAKTHDKPFFLAVGFDRPHVPFYVPQKWFDLHPLGEVILPEVRNDDLDDVPEIGRLMHELPKYPTLDFLQKNNNEQFRRCVQAYLACTTFVDHQVGRVVDALATSDYAKNTVIILWSDHGYHLGEKDRVSKHSLWEESARVPMIVVRPDEQRPGRQSNRPVGLIDVYPTILDLAGLPPRAANEGRSLRPLLDDGNADWRFAIITTYARQNHTLRSDRYRFIRYEDGSEELYDHRNDPHGWRNIAANPEHATLVKRFREELPKADAPYHEKVRTTPINAWFEAHFKRNNHVHVKASKKKTKK